jgi:integrase
MNPAPNIIALPQPVKTSPWIKTKYANLYRNRDSNKYHCIAKVCGELIRRSLKTKSIEIAKIKLDELLEQERIRLSKRVINEGATFTNLATEYRARVESSTDLKQRSKDYRIETLEIIEATWPNCKDWAPRRFTEQSILTWAEKLIKQYSGPRYNGAIQTLRGVLQIAVERGLLADNPVKTRKRRSTQGIPAARVKIEAPNLPDKKGFERLLAALKSNPRRVAAYRMVRLLASGGPRISAANQIRPENVRLDTNELIIPPIKYNTEPIILPMSPPLRELMKECLADYPGEGPLIPISNPKRALATSCKEAGIARLTPHDLRHLFTTRCLQAGIDVPTVAAWRGDRDGGAMLLKRYAHLLNDHSHKMAKRLKF